MSMLLVSVVLMYWRRGTVSSTNAQGRLGILPAAQRQNARPVRELVGERWSPDQGMSTVVEVDGRRTNMFGALPGGVASHRGNLVRRGVSAKAGNFGSVMASR